MDSSFDRFFSRLILNTAIRDFFSVQATVYRDSNDKILRAISQINLACDSNFGEALAARLAISLNFIYFTLDGDFQVVVIAHQHPFIV